MGKTQQALAQVEKKIDAYPKTASISTANLVDPCSTQNGSEQFQRLKANLMTRYPDRSIKTIVFCGTTHGNGSTTLASHFAVFLAADCRSKVLLVDVNLRTPGLHEVFHIRPRPGFSDCLGDENASFFSSMSSDGQNLRVLPCGSNSSGPLRLLETSRFDQFLKEARMRFDYVILDAPPLPIFSESRVICPKADGVILVVEAGKTRRQVALRARKELEDSGGTFLGVIINKRKHLIPEWIYKRL